MDANEELKQIVKDRYGKVATLEKEHVPNSCCGQSDCCSSDDLSVFSEDYTKLEGYDPNADLGLGCGLPTEYAHIKAGDTVVDLGSGAGNDCFVARSIVGESGKVIGVDMTTEMIAKARKNASKLKLNNVEFRLGEIEDLPIDDAVADIVVSNCVLNLVPDKKKALSETFRILKNGGHFSVSDIVTYDTIPEGLRKEAALYAGCVSGALIKEDYLNLIKEAGFTNIKIQKERKNDLPNEMLEKYMTKEETIVFKNEFAGIASITVYGEKQCCDKTTNCC